MRRSHLIISVLFSTMCLVSAVAKAEFVTKPKDKLRGADIGMASKSGGIERGLTMD